MKIQRSVIALILGACSLLAQDHTPGIPQADLSYVDAEGAPDSSRFTMQSSSREAAALGAPVGRILSSDLPYTQCTMHTMQHVSRS
jgi:hypothetical protein